MDNLKEILSERGDLLAVDKAVATLLGIPKLLGNTCITSLKGCSRRSVILPIFFLCIRTVWIVTV